MTLFHCARHALGRFWKCTARDRGCFSCCPGRWQAGRQAQSLACAAVAVAAEPALDVAKVLPNPTHCLSVACACLGAVYANSSALSSTTAVHVELEAGAQVTHCLRLACVKPIPKVTGACGGQMEPLGDRVLVKPFEAKKARALSPCFARPPCALSHQSPRWESDAEHGSARKFRAPFRSATTKGWAGWAAPASRPSAVVDGCKEGFHRAR